MIDEVKGTLSSCPKCKKWSYETVIFTNINTPNYKYRRSYCQNKECNYWENQGINGLTSSDNLHIRR